MLPNLLHRLRSQVEPDTLESLAQAAMYRLVYGISASVIPEKVNWYCSTPNYIFMVSLARFTNDLGFDPSSDGSSLIASAFTGNTFAPSRLKLAQILAVKLALNNLDDNVYHMLSWLPPYLNAYVYDNLNAAGIPNKLSLELIHGPQTLVQTCSRMPSIGPSMIGPLIHHIKCMQ